MVEEAPAPVMYRAPLPGSRVIGPPVDVTHDGDVIGFKLHVQGADITQHADTIQSAVAEIAALYRTITDAVTVTPDQEAGHGTAWVEVLNPHWVTRRKLQREDRLLNKQYYPGPTLDVAEGTVSVGVCADDGRDALWQEWVPGQGARHGWGVGSTGTGKSVGVSGLLISACSAGLVVPVLCDLQGGVSMPEWEDVAPYYATDEKAAAELLRRVVLEMRRRVAFMTGLSKYDRRKTVLDPSPEWPLIRVVVDEAPVLARNAQAMDDANTLVTLARKTGIGLTWLSQVANLDRSFGAAGNSMREQLQAGNTWVFQAGQTTGNLSVGQKTIEVGSIPPIAGASILAAPKHMNPPMLKAWWLEDRPGLVDQYVKIPDHDPLPVSDRPPATVIPLAPPRTFVPPPVIPAPVGAPPAGEPGTSCADAVAAFLTPHGTGDVVTTGQVLSATGFSRSRVHDVLRDLVTNGVLRDGDYGKWVIL